MLTVKEYKTQETAYKARYKEYLKKCREVDETQDNDILDNIYYKIEEEYADIVNSFGFKGETLITEEFFEYYHTEFERKFLILHLIPFYGKELKDGSVFVGVVYSNGYYYYYVKNNGEYYYKTFGDEEFESKIEQLVLHTEKSNHYAVKCNDGWDNYFHTLEIFETEEEAKEFIAEREKWKEEFKEEFGVDYNTLKDSDFTREMEDWLNEFVNINENKEEIKYYIEEI